MTNHRACGGNYTAAASSGLPACANAPQGAGAVASLQAFAPLAAPDPQSTDGLREKIAAVLEPSFKTIQGCQPQLDGHLDSRLRAFP
jgi:hypothetical protein